VNGDRHEPLPNVSQLPAYLWRRSPRAAKIGAGIALAAAVALAVALAPGIRESKEERGRSEAAAEARQRAALVRELRAEQSPVRGALPAGGLEAAVLADARRREPGHPVRRAECEPLPPRPNRYACLAVTAEIPAGPSNEAGAIGYPYRAVVDPGRRRFSLCKIAGRAGEGAITADPVVTVPAACGGDT
jgi:hypothetical protein